jgi:hypothetical protein
MRINSAASGRFDVRRLLSGGPSRGLHEGVDHQTGQPVQIAHTVASAFAADELQARSTYDLPGVAPCLYAGPLDAPDPMKGDDPDSRVVIEALPRGRRLTDHAAPLPPASAVSIGLGLARVVQAAVRAGRPLDGIRPDLVWVSDDATSLTAIAPRSWRFLIHLDRRKRFEEWAATFSEGVFQAPEHMLRNQPSPTNDLYAAGLVIATMAQGHHPFPVPDGWAFSPAELMEDDRNRVLAGPPPLAAILARVLVADPSRRMSIDELVAELERLAQTIVAPA